MSHFQLWWIALFLAVSAVPTVAQSASSGLLEDYYPAFIRSGTSSDGGGFELVIFASGKQQIPIEVPFQLRMSAYAPRGTALYATSAESTGCFTRINFSPERITRLACPQGLTVLFNFTVSAGEDNALLSGHLGGNPGKRCGIFEVRLADGVVRQIIGVDDCTSFKFENSWRSLSLSPQGDEAVAVRGHRLELINLAKGATRVIAVGISQASWSPDGHWIAALTERGTTDLIAPSDFKRRRTLPGSEVQWSPDSRYLLRIKQCFLPFEGGVGKVQALDVQSGKIETIKSSRCTVSAPSNGWIVRSALP